MIMVVIFPVIPKPTAPSSSGSANAFHSGSSSDSEPSPMLGKPSKSWGYAFASWPKSTCVAPVRRPPRFPKTTRRTEDYLDIGAFAHASGSSIPHGAPRHQSRTSYRARCGDSWVSRCHLPNNPKNEVYCGGDRCRARSGGWRGNNHSRTPSTAPSTSTI